MGIFKDMAINARLGATLACDKCGGMEDGHREQAEVGDDNQLIHKLQPFVSHAAMHRLCYDDSSAVAVDVDAAVKLPLPQTQFGEKHASFTNTPNGRS